MTEEVKETVKETVKEEVNPRIELAAQDIAMMVNIIDLVSQRGGILGTEMLVVGMLRERLNNALVEKGLSKPNPSTQGVNVQYLGVNK